ncbi:MAG: PDZ domain-containing protein, partial [Pseudolabrys sp.]
PANMVRVVVTSAKTGGNAVVRPWLGAKLQAVTSEIADSMGLKRPTGALVSNVAANSPAANAGLKAGDLILSVDGQEVDDPNAFDYRFGTKPVGGSARLGILRGGREQTATVSLRSAPATPREEIVIRSRSPFSGVKIANLSPALADELQLQNVDQGVAIVDVDTGSYASNLGFQRGDVIEEVNGERISKTGDLERLAGTPNRSWRIIILRGGQKISAVFSG